MTAALACRTCGSEPRAGARFCDACGTPFEVVQRSAEYKQVTVMFTDVVHSMDIAAAVGPERLREIMSDLLDRSISIVQRYGGTVDKFTGDGIMAVFGAPIALEDHALRACMAALDIQRDIGVTLRLRIGLNSGQVVAGEIGSMTASYTAIGAQVGMAQRMESAARPGAVMLSESTARLVEDAATLGDVELLHVKGSDIPVKAQRLLSIGERHRRRRGEARLIGRSWELNTVTALLDEAVAGTGCVVNIVGPPGIGKSRLVREAAAIASVRGLPVFSTHCESHAREIPFHALARLMRSATGVAELAPPEARARIREQFRDADPEDLALLVDLLGIRDSGVDLPQFAADARRRRLTALINSASLDRAEAAVYVIEDAHWIDEASESLLADFLAVVPHTSSLTLVTYRPEYQGVFARLSGAQTISLRPLADTDFCALTTELLGTDASVSEIGTMITDRAAGNPFFAEEMVRDLSERGVVVGRAGCYQLRSSDLDVSVPATLQATIGARIDRLGAPAKRTLHAASVIGAEFDAESLTALTDSTDVTSLIEAELVDQVRFSPLPVYAFRHPMIRSVAYESQLKAQRAELHKRLAITIERHGAKSANENAALIAEHYERAGDLTAAFDWHMRAGAWLNNRNNVGAATSWQRALRLADLLPENDPERLSKQIAPRTMLCATGFRLTASGSDSHFEELRELCVAADDQQSLVTAMTGPIMAAYFDGRRREASALATEQIRLLQSLGDPVLTLWLITAAISTKHETAEMRALLDLSEYAIGLAGDGSPSGGFTTSSPLAMALSFRGLARSCIGHDGWREDFERALQIAKSTEPVTRGGVLYYTHTMAMMQGALLPNEAVMEEMAEVLATATRTGEDVAYGLAKANLALAELSREDGSREYALDLLAQVRELAVQHRYSRTAIPLIDVYVAHDRAIHGDLDGAIDLGRAVVKEEIGNGGTIFVPLSTHLLVSALLERGTEADLVEAGSAIDQMESVPREPGLVFYDVWLLRLRTLLARVRGDYASYLDYRDSYRKMAAGLGFEGHMAWAEAME